MGLLATWNAIRNLLERTGNSDFHVMTIKVGYEQLVDSPRKEALRACRQADPVIGARFDRGVDAAKRAVAIVCRGAEPSSCQGTDLSRAERATLRESARLLPAAVPAKH
ncbi:hypothetical protein AB0395_21120 [Streptosporangium sp. NPDC051023]|uniref:hypothetical protein n=1 Tax=Streptosporangium sp. NPDC051023 TaxID=3155410 RepID=UPI0034500EAD